MNKKEILGAVCSLVCVINFAIAQPVSAIKTVSADNQESYAQKLLSEALYGHKPKIYSDDAIQKGIIIKRIQERVCNANGIEVTNNRFTKPHDYQTKMHYINIIDDYHNGAALGGGHIYIGVDLVNDYLADKKSFRNQFDYIANELMISHEMGHNLRGHSIESIPEDRAEQEAEDTSLALGNALLEGGWGAFLVAKNRCMNRPTQNRNIMDSFERDAYDRIKIESPRRVHYKAKDGNSYRLTIPSNNNDDRAYFAGQIAECIAKDALRLENLRIVPNHLKNEIKFGGHSLLICESPNLPNGYRILAAIEFDKDFEEASTNLKIIKSLILQNGVQLGNYNIVHDEAYKAQNDCWIMWLACAVAYDNQSR